MALAPEEERTLKKFLQERAAYDARVAGYKASPVAESLIAETLAPPVQRNLAPIEVNPATRSIYSPQKNIAPTPQPPPIQPIPANTTDARPLSWYQANGMGMGEYLGDTVARGVNAAPEVIGSGLAAVGRGASGFLGNIFKGMGQQFDQAQADIKYKQAQAMQAQYEASEKMLTQQATQNWPRFQKKTPLIGKFMQQAFKDRQQMAKKYEQEVPTNMTMQDVMAGVQMYNSTPGVDPWTPLDQATLDRTPQAMGWLLEKNILPPDVLREVKMSGAKEQAMKQAQFKAKQMELLGAGDLFTMNPGAPQPLPPGVAGPPNVKAQPYYELSQKGRQLVPPGMTPAEFQTDLARGSGQGFLKNERDAQGNIIEQRTGRIERPPTFSDSQYALLEAATKANQAAIEAEAKLPAERAKLGTKAFYDMQMERAKQTFEETQNKIAQEAAVTRAKELEASKKRLLQAGTAEKKTILEFSADLKQNENYERIAQEAQARLDQLAAKAEIDAAARQEDLGAKTVLQSMRLLAQKDMLDTKLAASALKGVSGSAGEATARAVMKNLYKAGKLDMVALAEELATDKPLSKILKDVIIETSDEFNTPIVSRIAEIMGSKSGKETSTKQLQGLSFELSQQGFAPNSKERRLVQGQIDAIEGNKRIKDDQIAFSSFMRHAASISGEASTSIDLESGTVEFGSVKDPIKFAKGIRDVVKASTNIMQPSVREAMLRMADQLDPPVAWQPPPAAATPSPSPGEKKAVDILKERLQAP